MSTATLSNNVLPMITQVLNPGFKGVPDSVALTKYFLNSVATIRRYGLPVRIYVTKEVADRIGNILTAIGIKFKLIPAEKMTPPYIFVYQNGSYFVIRTVDEAGRVCNEFTVPINKFVEELQSYVLRKKKTAEKKVEEVHELVMDEDFDRFISGSGTSNE